MSLLAKATAAFFLLAPLATAPADPAPAPEMVLDPIVIQVPRVSTDATAGASAPDAAELERRKGTTGDGAELLRGVPGVTLSGAGGISSLPAIHGLSDDRLRILVDGAELATACPNHMNSPLSYADPAKVETVTVFAGVAPVSVGGDSIGGSIQVRSASPEFAGYGERFRVRGSAGSFYRSNGEGYGYSAAATAALQWMSLSFSQSSSWSDNLVASASYKPAEPGIEGGSPIPGDVIASSAYRAALRRSLGLALRRAGHLLQLEASQQTVGFEGFPNQRMDMTDNDNLVFTVRYTGAHSWGDLEARLDYQTTDHEMDMGPDRFSYGTGMPMNTEAKNRAALVRANVNLSARHLLRTGAEYQYYTLYDWWPPVGGTMGPNAFWNVDAGERRRIDAYAEWEARWSPAWTSLVGVRSDTVTTDAGPVQGYDNGLAAWADDAAAFNARDRRRTDQNWNVTASARFTPSPTQAYEAGYARKERSPNLYQRYAWSTNAMAALMNNLVGDGNGYVGDVALGPETAHTVSVTGGWNDAADERWNLRASAHLTRVHGYIDARRCDFGQCSAQNATATTGFVLLQYVNHEARLHGGDLSGQLLLARSGRLGRLTARGTLSVLRGDDLTTGDNLYAIVPLSGSVALVHERGGWTATAELAGATDKERLSRVRNEVPTAGYTVVNLRAGYAWKHVRLDTSVENVLDRLYSNPLGGAYVGQGPSMSTTGTPWGVAVPGAGRSLNVAVNMQF
jgi:iron complex outermembrane receptor protein